MNKDEYLKIENSVNGAISLLVKGYNREERKWILPADKAIEAQTKIRDLKHFKQMAWEQYKFDADELPAQLKQMLQPILIRRKFRLSKVEPNLDGSRFVFIPALEDIEYQAKHVRGFWSCTACMLDPEKLPGIADESLAIYKRAIQWCPRFAVGLANGLDPEEYKAKVRSIRDDATVCYAGLLHAELQVTDTEAKMVRVCDTCGYRSEENKELAKPTEEFSIGVDVGRSNNKGEDNIAVRCICKICKAVVFDVMKQDAVENDRLKPEYEKMLDDHYKQFHPEYKE